MWIVNNCGKRLRLPSRHVWPIRRGRERFTEIRAFALPLTDSSLHFQENFLDILNRDTTWETRVVRNSYEVAATVVVMSAGRRAEQSKSQSSQESGHDAALRSCVSISGNIIKEIA